MGIISNFPTGSGGGGKSIRSAVVTLTPNSFVYDGTEKTQTVASVVLDNVTLTEGRDYVVLDNSATNAGAHTLNVVGIVTYSGSVSASWSIARAVLTRPALVSDSFTYDGSSHTVQLNAAYDASKMGKDGNETATNAGSYTLRVSLLDSVNYEWDNGTTAPLSFPWSIAKRQYAKPTVTGSLTYNASAQSPTLTGYVSASMSQSGDTSATNAGSYALIVSLTDTANNEWSDSTTAPVSLAWSIGKAQGSVSVSPASLSISGEGSTDTSTVTVVGDGTVSVASADTSIATASLSGSTVTVTVVGDGTVNVTVTLGDGTNYLGASAVIVVECSLVSGGIYGVSWNKSSSTVLSRTDDAALFTDPVPAISGGTGSSPFDGILPWSGMVKETIDGNVMVKIPKFWYKWTNTTGALQLQIANYAADGFHTSPAHADRGDGKGERDYVYIGRYHCASDYKSKTGVKPVASITRATARSNCKNLGSGYSQLDYAMWWTVRMLYLVEFANWDSQAKIGYGCGDNNATHNSGYSDTAQYHTGTMQSSRTTYGKGVQYRYIEDPWGNVYDWCDGIVLSSLNPYVTNVVANYGDSTANHTQVGNGPSSNGEITGWNVPTTSGLEWALFPSSTTSSSSYDTYVADYVSAGNPCVYVGGLYVQGRNIGMFCSYSNSASYTSARVGARLQYLP